MAFSNRIDTPFIFGDSATFAERVRENRLIPGVIYFLDDVICVALTTNTYRTYGGASLGDIVNALLQNEAFKTEIVTKTSENSVFRNLVATAIINNADFRTFIAETLLSDADFKNKIIEAIASLQIEQIVQNILNQALSIVAPDGSSIATNDGGKLTLQAATNSQFGIVRGQSNNTLATWHNASAENGTLSINRVQVEAVMDSKDTNIRNAINVRAEDDCIVGRNNNGIITLNMRLLDEEPANNTGLSFIRENANSH